MPSKSQARFRTLFSWRMLAILSMGFSSGLPLLLVGSTLKAWLTEAKLDLTLLGFFSLVGLPYILKFFWSPVLDRFVPPFLGRRRGWIFITQVLLTIALFGMSLADPQASVGFVATLAIIIAFLSATQDVALDAYRREILATEQFGVGNSLFITGYRLAMILAGGGALILAQHYTWHFVYLIMAGAMSVGLVTTLLAPEPEIGHALPKTLREAVVEPFFDFFKRRGALFILAFLIFYKLADSMATEMTMPFYLLLGFTKTEVGSIVKVFGIWATIGGGLIGGGALLRFGVYRSLWVFGILQALANLGFAWLAHIGPNPSGLIAVITLENMTAGMATSVFVTFMASVTNKKYTATQYALLSSLTGVPRVLISSPTGWMAKHLGWETFFVVCTSCAVPGLILLFVLNRLGVFAQLESEDDQDPPTNAQFSKSEPLPPAIGPNLLKDEA